MRRYSLTPGQSACLAFIREALERGDVAPSYDEIAAAIGQKSKSGVHRLIHGLVERGHLEIIPGRRRCLTLPASQSVRFMTDADLGLGSVA